jgi:hypothetical protein
LSLRLRLLAAFAYVLVLVLIVLEIPLVLSLSSRVNAEVKSQAAAQAQVVATAAAAQGGDPARLRRLVRQAGRDLGASGSSSTRAGGWSPTPAGTGLSLTSYRNRPEIAAALAAARAGDAAQRHARQRSPLHRRPGLGEEPSASSPRASMRSVPGVRRNVLVVIGVGLVALALDPARLGGRRPARPAAARARSPVRRAASKTASSMRGQTSPVRASSVRLRSPSTT